MEMGPEAVHSQPELRPKRIELSESEQEKIMTSLLRVEDDVFMSREGFRTQLAEHPEFDELLYAFDEGMELLNCRIRQELHVSETAWQNAILRHSAHVSRKG
jgi:hypothetical protein